MVEKALAIKTYEEAVESYYSEFKEKIVKYGHTNTAKWSEEDQKWNSNNLEKIDNLQDELGLDDYDVTNVWVEAS